MLFSKEGLQEMPDYGESVCMLTYLDSNYFKLLNINGEKDICMAHILGQVVFQMSIQLCIVLAGLYPIFFSARDDRLT